MLPELGPLLAALLRDALPGGTSVRIGSPATSWAADEPPVVGLFPYRVLENRSADPAGVWVEDRDADGRVVGRQAAERRYDVAFLVTAWAADTESELDLLGTVLRVVATTPVVPAVLLTGSLAKAQGPVTLAVGTVPYAGAELWPALGVPARTCLDVVATAPLTALGRFESAPPPHTVDLAVSGPPAVLRPPGPADLPRSVRREAARITEGPRDGQARREAW